MVINETYVTVHGEYDGDYSHTQSMLKLTRINLKLDIPRNQDVQPQEEKAKNTRKAPNTNSPKSDTAKKNFNFLLKGKFNNLNTEIVFNLTGIYWFFLYNM